jgi:sialic acid synthase
MIKIIAELGINHQGNIDTMKKMMNSAKDCGANFVKSQKREPKECLSAEQYNRPYDSINSFGKTYGEHKEFLEFSIEEWKHLMDYADEIGIKLFASVFDITSAQKINSLGVEMFKVGSGEVVKLELLEEIASYNKLIIMSTGMSTLAEIDAAFEIIKKNEVVLMQTTSTYPCDEKDVNLRVLKTYLDRYKVPVGLSGHYIQGSGAIEAAAVGMGATWFERHFTLDRTMKGTDQVASLEDSGLTRVIKSVRSAEIALGNSEKSVCDSELQVRKKVRGY